MNPFDILVIIIMGFCVVRGLFRGLIKEVSSIVGVLAGFYAAYTYYPLMGSFLKRWISDPSYLNILGFLIIFCLVLIIVSILGVIIKYLMKIAFLGWVDRICGVGFGAIKGVLIVSVILMMLTAFLPKDTPLLRGSRLAPQIMMVAENMAKVVPGEMKRQFYLKLESLKKNWKIKPIAPRVPPSKT
jgi:membrane protein required for colicin V production